MVKIGISWVVIDKVRFWSNALGEKEIQDEMNGSIAFVHSPGKATIQGDHHGYILEKLNI